MAEQSEQPIINVQPVNSGQEGHEALAKTLGSIGQEAGETAVTMASEESSSMYINSVANIEQLKKTAQINMLQDRDNAPRIAEQTRDAMDQISKIAYVNSKDRSKLKAYISGAQDDVELKAAQTETEQRQRMAAFTHFANFPDQLQAYHAALMSNPEQADQLHDAMVSSLRGLVGIGAITPEQAGSSIKLMQGTVDSANNYYQLASMGGATAQDYHTVASTPLNHEPNSPTAPINESTGWLVDHYAGDRSLQGVLADLSNRTIPNIETFTALKPHEQQQAIQYMTGVQQADGMINSGQPYNLIKKEYQEMSQKGTELSYRDQAKKNALGKYIQQLEAGNYLKIMAQTPAGNGIFENFNSRNSAIMNNDVLSNDYKQSALMDNKNKFVDQMVANGQGHHIPDGLIQPIPQADVTQLQTGFQLNQDPNLVLQAISQYDKHNQPYLAQAIKDPNQRMVVSALSMVDLNISTQQKLDFISANQTGRSGLKLVTEKGLGDKPLLNRISTNLTKSLSLVRSTYTGGDSQTLQSAMVDSTLKYAKYLAAKDGHEGTASANDMKKYIDQASQIYMNSYRTQSGSNWIVNSQQLPQPLSNGQLDSLSSLITNEGYKYLHEGRSDEEYQSAIGRNPLTMVVTPTGQLQAVDGNGTPYYSIPYNNNLLAYAAAFQKASKINQRLKFNEYFGVDNKKSLSEIAIEQESHVHNNKNPISFEMKNTGKSLSELAEE